MGSEIDDLNPCRDCGELVSAGLDRSFVFGPEEGDVLCWSCAERRGGAYDEVEDRWVLAPRLDGLLGGSPLAPS